MLFPKKKPKSKELPQPESKGYKTPLDNLKKPDKPPQVVPPKYQGYQPTQGQVNSYNPPQGCSGLPSRKRGKGRPSKYPNIDMDLVKQLVEYGHDDAFIAKCLKIDRVTFIRWKEKHPEFCHTIKDWKDKADARVEKALYERARGYKHKAKKIFCNNVGEVTEVEYEEQYAPDPTSMIFWLKNRQPEKWRDTSEKKISGNLTIDTLKDIPDDELDKTIQELNE